MELLIFSIWIISGLICYKIAEDKGLNKGLAFVGGLLFGLFAIIGYALAGESEEKKKERIKEAVKEQRKEEEENSYDY